MGFSFNRWWGRRAPSGPTWQPLRETPGQRRRFARWAAAKVYLNWTGPWFTAYHHFRAGFRPAWPVQPLPTSPDGPPRGVALLYDERIGPVNFGHLFTLLRERILALGYRVAHADAHCPDPTHPADVVEKYVLHPVLTPESGAGPGYCNQRYGQVTLDLVRRDRRPLMLRLLAVPLPDTIFSPAPPFDELLGLVLGCDA